MCDRRKSLRVKGKYNDVRCRDMGSDEITREVVVCGGNEDVKVDEWSHQAVEPLFYRFKNV